MEGCKCITPFVLSIFLYLASAWQTPDVEFLKSLSEDKYQHLLQNLACKNLNDEIQRNNCGIVLQEDQLLTDENLAAEWLDELNAIQINVSYEGAIASFNYQTNMTAYNQEVKSSCSMLTTTWSTAKKAQARRFNYKQFANEALVRQFDFILTGGTLDDNEQREYFDEVSNGMVDIYGKGQVCRPTPNKNGKPSTDGKKNGGKNGQQEEECLSLEPDLEQILAHSRDYDELLWVWKGWRDAVGPGIGELYPEWVRLKNHAAQNGNFSDHGELLRFMYEIKDDGLEAMADKLFEEVKPLYELLHAFVRRRLSETYPGRVQPTGPIPAHLFGNMWSQQWNNIYDIAKPYKEVDEVDVTEEMVAQKYDANHMFKVAENFFLSIGLDPMPANFWKYSMIEKPKDRDAVCHGSAFNFMKDREVRIKMCTEVNMEDLYTVHHEMGHCEYYLQYSGQPWIFRTGANPGFHEAVGDTIALSVTTPSYLHTIKLMDSPTTTYEKTINYQMKIALSKIAFLPFGLMIDKWRWEVFRGNIKPEEYNAKWWEYRLKYQGIVPPVERTENDFDPGAKYHIASGTPYIRYFVSFLIQFQFQRALCKEAGHVGPLHECNIYESKEAGAKLKEMLAMGISRPWTEALEVLTGETEIDTSAIKEYFEPLIEWLQGEMTGETRWEDVEQDVEETNEGRFWQELQLLNELEKIERILN